MLLPESSQVIVDVLIWALVLGFVAAYIFPAWKILTRMGFSFEKRVLYMVLGPGLLGLWLIAEAEWPAVDGTVDNEGRDWSR
jgi:TRAP-type C4-dicarboxylate transport system permease small subunit